MRTTILVALSGMLAFNIQGVIAGCYTHGREMTAADNANARKFAHDACYNNGGMFTGYFSPGQTKSMCPRADSDIPMLFKIENQNKSVGFDLGDDDCYLRLNNLITGCSRGGDDQIAGWHFTYDPENC
ncbi:hypothetical protein B0J14DRAFT_374965 [Halenospora varia]|nr:hypothetical protein B0J14DRAFT_78316 [Halenospora varia]KAH6675941.1 hypothetical protein B0J14DRAFT_374965 [Halenospora varia]